VRGGQCRGLLEEVFADDGKEFGRVGGGIGVDEADLTACQAPPQGGEFGTQHLRPLPVGVTPAEPGRAIGVAARLVELVREFVDDDVVAVVGVGGAGQHIVPTQQQLPLLPRLAGQGAACLVGQTAAVGLRAVDDEGARINQHLAQVAKAAAGAVEQEQGGLRRDQHPHLVIDRQARAADERNLGHQHLDMLLHLQLKVDRQTRKGRHAAAQDVAPGGRKGLPPHPAAAPCGHQCRPGQPGHHGQ